MVNPVAAGFIAGGVLARNSGGAAFAAFSLAIDLFLRRETPECALSRLLYWWCADGVGFFCSED
jgi:hypothetical protein